MKAAHVQAVLDALRPLRNRYTSEDGLQRAVGRALTAAGIESLREQRVTAKERIDFEAVFKGGAIRVGIEVKVKGGQLEHLRQLYRYAPHYEDLVLVTTQASRPEDQELNVLSKREGPLAGPNAVPLHVCRLHVINISLNI